PPGASDEVSEQVAETAGRAAGRAAQEILEAYRLSRKTVAAFSPGARATWASGPFAGGAHAGGVGTLAKSFVAELVVELPFLDVAEHVVGVVHQLEALLGLLVPRVLVGVQLRGKLAVRLLDDVRLRVFRHAEHGVEVVGHGCRAREGKSPAP